MKIRSRPRNALPVFSFECVPDKTVWCEEKYIGAEVHCYVDRDINNMQDLSEAETAAREFLAQSGWIVNELLEEPRWEKIPSRICCLFSKVLKARRIAMDIACQDGASLIAYTWEQDTAESEEEK